MVSLKEPWDWLDRVANTFSPLSLDDFSTDLVLDGANWGGPGCPASLQTTPGPTRFPARSEFQSPTPPLVGRLSVFAAPGQFPLHGSGLHGSESSSLGDMSPPSFSPAMTTDGAPPSTASFILDVDSPLNFAAAPTAVSGDDAVPYAPPMSASPTQGMSDADFQWLFDGLISGDLAHRPAGSEPLPQIFSTLEPTPPPPLIAGPDEFALHAFSPLDLDLNVLLPPPPPPLPLPAAPVFPLPSAPPAPAPDNSQLRCLTCHRTFPTPCRRRKHEHTHTRPFACSICKKGHAAKKDLHRHLWTTHPDAAVHLEIPSPLRTCPIPGCGFEGRQDNLTRHVRTKHPRE